MESPWADIPSPSENAAIILYTGIKQISECLKDTLKGAHIHTDILGSDHCPVECTLDI